VLILREAMGRLAERAVEPLAASSLWSSAPVDCPPGSPPFVNAVVVLRVAVAETPEAVLAWLQELEREFGRRPKAVLNEPRPLDLDLIDWEGTERRSDRLTLPHPRAILRRFVLEPLAEIAPRRVLAGQTRCVAELLQGLATAETVVRLAE
jgi:2-amino-4-hydroxy-6-hydroxymethyldihydropteridine diphosphokinase